MIKRTVFLLVLVALAIPAAAAATLIDVTGPTSISGHGPVRGVLRSAVGPARVELQLSGKIRVSGKADDLQVSCEGARVKSRDRVSPRGLKVVVCMGRRMTVVVSASAFHFGAIARRYVIQVPEGVTGKLSGRFREPQPPADQQPVEPQAPAEQ